MHIFNSQWIHFLLMKSCPRSSIALPGTEAKLISQIAPFILLKCFKNCGYLQGLSKRILVGSDLLTHTPEVMFGSLPPAVAADEVQLVTDGKAKTC